MINYAKSNTKVKRIEQGDSDFRFIHGNVVYSRASIEISAMCPVNIRLAVERAISDGYLKSVVYVKENDYMWEKLGE